MEDTESDYEIDESTEIDLSADPDCTHENTKTVEKSIGGGESIIVDTICMDCGASV